MSASGTASRPTTGATASGAPGERELLERVKVHDLDAFERLYRMYQPRLARFLTNLVRRPQLVEEVLDDTMMVVWNTAGSFRGTSKLSTWVFAIAYRKALKARMRWPDPLEDRATGQAGQQRCRARCRAGAVANPQRAGRRDGTDFPPSSARSSTSPTSTTSGTARSPRSWLPGRYGEDPHVPCPAPPQAGAVRHIGRLALGARRCRDPTLNRAEPHHDAEELLPWYRDRAARWRRSGAGRASSFELRRIAAASSPSSGG